MAWHPRLVVRTGKGGGVSSPTSSLGYGFIGCLATVALVGIIAAATHGKPLMLVGLIIPGVFLRDVWAWFGSTPEEREAFRAQVAEYTSYGRGMAPDQAVIAQGTPLMLAVGLVGLAASVFLLLRNPREPFFFMLIMVAAIFCGGMLIDVVRQALTGRRARKP